MADAINPPGRVRRLARQAGTDAASTLVRVTALLKPNFLMAISAVAAISEDRIR